MLYLVLHLSLNALAPIIIYLWGREINHDVLILISALTAVVIFNLLNLKYYKSTYTVLAAKPKVRSNVAKIMLTTAFMWIAGFIIPIQYTPFIFVFTYLGWPGFFGSLVMAITTKKFSYFLQLALISIIFVIFYLHMFQEYSIIKAAIGFIITMLTGLSLYLYLRFSRQLNFQGINSTQILALRYWLLLLFPLALVLIRHEINQINMLIIFKSSIIGLFSLVLPLYFGQLCIEKFGAEKFSLFMGITPILTFMLQLLIIKSELDHVIIALLLALAIILPYVFTQVAYIMHSKLRQLSKTQ